MGPRELLGDSRSRTSPRRTGFRQELNTGFRAVAERHSGEMSMGHNLARKGSGKPPRTGAVLIAAAGLSVVALLGLVIEFHGALGGSSRVAEAGFNAAGGTLHALGASAPPGGSCPVSGPLGGLNSVESVLAFVLAIAAGVGAGIVIGRRWGPSSSSGTGGGGSGKITAETLTLNYDREASMPSHAPPPRAQPVTPLSRVQAASVFGRQSPYLKRAGAPPRGPCVAQGTRFLRVGRQSPPTSRGVPLRRLALGEKVDPRRLWD